MERRERCRGRKENRRIKTKKEDWRRKIEEWWEDPIPGGIRLRDMWSSVNAGEGDRP